jgi:hypothetical protein
MREPNKNTKKIVFYDTDHNHAKLRIKFIEHGIKQKTFFREIVQACINDDPLILQWLEKNPNCKITKRSMKMRKRQDKEVQQEIKKFNLNNEDLDELFDIISEDDKL